MREVKPYQVEKDKVFATGESKYLKGDKLRAGEVVWLRHISGSFENIGTSEQVELGYWNGHAFVPLFTGSPAKTGGFVHRNINIWLREQQYVYAYFADVANGEKMKLRANGRFE